MELYKSQGTANAEYVVMKNSETIAERAFYFQGTAGAEEMDAIANDARGLVLGFIDSNGAPLGSGHEDSGLTGTLTQSRLGNSYAAAGDNVTVDQVQVHGRLVEAGDIYTAEMDADIGTTTGSDTPGYFVSVSTSDATKLDEGTTTATQSGNTFAMLVDNGLGANSCQHPDRGGNWVLFKVVEIQE